MGPRVRVQRKSSEGGRSGLAGAAWKGRVALLKGAIMVAFGLGVLAEASVKLLSGGVPREGGASA